MTEHLHQTDSYIQEFEAVVTATEGQDVALDRTAFYPGGGGQPPDVGTLTWEGGSAQVVKVRKQGDEVWHSLKGDPPPVGTPVHGALDWERRYQLMRTHTALHVLCGVVWRDYGASVTGGNMEPLQGRMDFEFETMHKELVAEIEASVNAEIEKDHPARVAILPREEAFQIPDLIRTKINLLPPQIQEVRTVEIVGLDLQADGGTHVANTAEVGRVRVVDYKSKGAINKRIYIELEVISNTSGKLPRPQLGSPGSSVSARSGLPDPGPYAAKNGDLAIPAERQTKLFQESPQLFTVRVWREDLGNGRWEWRGRVEHEPSGETGYFRDWKMLISALEEMLAPYEM